MDVPCTKLYVIASPLFDALPRLGDAEDDEKSKN